MWPGRCESELTLEIRARAQRGPTSFMYRRIKLTHNRARLKGARQGGAQETIVADCYPQRNQSAPAIRETGHLGRDRMFILYRV